MRVARWNVLPICLTLTVSAAARDLGGNSKDQCPVGYVQSSALIFKCGVYDHESGESWVLLIGGKSVLPIVIPAQVHNCKIRIEADGPLVSAVVRNLDTRAIVANATISNEVSIGQNLQNATVLDSNASGGSAAIEVSSLSSDGSSVAIFFRGVTPAAFGVSLAGRSDLTESVRLHYAYDDGFDACQGGPFGCIQYDSLLTRDTVYNWSVWASGQYGDASRAWMDLCAASGSMGVIPMQAWDAVWLVWPDSKLASASVPSRAAFDFIDNLEEKDHVVTATEFEKAYKFAVVGLSVFTWCTSLHSAFRNATAVWEYFAPRGSIDFPTWLSIWSEFEPPDGFEKVRASESFLFADASQTNEVSFQEFEDIWGECENRYTGAEKPKIATTTTSTTVRTTTTRTTSTTSTSSLRALDTSRSRAQAFSPITEMTTTVETSVSATTNPSVMSPCCNKFRSDCMACHANTTETKLCSDAAFADNLPGCGRITDSTGSGIRSTYGPKTVGQSTCPYSGVAFGPPLANGAPGQVRTQEENVTLCQRRCQLTLGCMFFSFWWLGSTCLIHGSAARWSAASGAVSGPNTCVADIKITVPNVGNAGSVNISDAKLAGARARFAEDIANDLNLNSAEDVFDLPGHRRAVTLALDSMVVEARVRLPAGRSTNSLIYSNSIGSRLATAWSRVGLSTVGDIGGLSMTSHPRAECLLQSTRYRPPAPTIGSFDDPQKELPFADSSTSPSVEDCRTKCSLDPSCFHFTYWSTGSSSRCDMLGDAVVLERAVDATSGPGACQAVPNVAADNALPAFVGTARQWADTNHPRPFDNNAVFATTWSVMFATISMCICIGLGYRREGRRRSSGDRYEILSRAEFDAEDSDGEETSR